MDMLLQDEPRLLQQVQLVLQQGALGISGFRHVTDTTQSIFFSFSFFFLAEPVQPEYIIS